MIKCVCGAEDCKIKVRFDPSTATMLVDGKDDGPGISVMLDANGIVEMVWELRGMLDVMLGGGDPCE